MKAKPEKKKASKKQSPRPVVRRVLPRSGGDGDQERRVELATTFRHAAWVLADWDERNKRWIDLQAIAAEVGCSPQNLYKDPKLKIFRDRQRRVSAVGGSKGRVILKPSGQDDHR